MGNELQHVKVPVAQLERACGDDGGVIAKLIQSRQITVREGATPLVSGVRAFLDAVRQQARNASLTAARDGAREARAEAAELALLIDERAMVDDEDANAALAAACGAITSEIGVICARSTRDMRLRRVVEDALYDAQAEIAQAVEALAGDLSQVGKSSPARKTRKAGPSRKSATS